MKLIRYFKAWAAARVLAHAIRNSPGGEGTLMNFLSGYKTYLTAAAVVATLVGLANGTLDIPQAIEALAAAGLFSTLRHAASSSAGTAVVSFLSGYKTYLVALGAVVSAAAAYATGNAGLVDTVQIVVTALMGVFLRNGMKAKP